MSVEGEAGIGKTRLLMAAQDLVQVGRNLRGMGVHEASGIAALGEGGQILASRDTAAGGRYPIGDPRSVALKGITAPMEIVTIAWR
jgi:class 3 adenylate cyclase